MGTRARRIILIAVIIALAAFFRLWQIESVPPGLYPDEAMNGNNALETLRTKDFNVFYPENNGREGLFINIQALSIALFGNEPWALRIISAIFGILTVFFTYLFTKELFRNQVENQELRTADQKGGSSIPDSKSPSHNLQDQMGGLLPTAEIIALLAAFFVATSFWHINFSRIGFRAIMAPFFLTASMYFAWFLFKDTLSQTKKTLAAVAGGILLGAGFYSYIAYRLMPLLLVFPLRAMMSKKNTPKRASCHWCAFVLFLFFALVTAVPLGMYYLDHPEDFLGRTSQVSIFTSENPARVLSENIARTLGMFWWEGDYNWRHNFSGAPQLWWPVGILFGIGILIGIYAIFSKRGPDASGRGKKHAFIFLFLFSWIALGLLPVILSNEGIPHALRAILIIPPVMILAAYALLEIILYIRKWIAWKESEFKEYARQLGRIRKELMLLLFLFFLAVTMHTFNQYFLRWAHHPDVQDAFSAKYAAIGRWLEQMPMDVPKYVIVNAQGVMVPTPGGAATLPMPAQTPMFIADSWNAALQKEKNIYFIFPDQIENISCASRCAITMLETNGELAQELRDTFPDIRSSLAPGFLVFEK